MNQLSINFNKNDKLDNISNLFESIHNHIYANDGLSPDQALEEFIKIIFIKMYSESKNDSNFYITTYESQNIKNGNKVKSFEERLKKIEKNCFENFNYLFEKNESIKLKITTIEYIFSKLQNIEFKIIHQNFIPFPTP